MVSEGWFLIGSVIGGFVAFVFHRWAIGGFSFNPAWLPAVLVVIDVACAVGYAAVDGAEAWRKVVYWLAAAALTAVVTW